MSGLLNSPQVPPAILSYTFSRPQDTSPYIYRKANRNLRPIGTTNEQRRDNSVIPFSRKSILKSAVKMNNSQYQNMVDPRLLTNQDDPAIPDSILDEIYPFGIPESNIADAPQASDTLFDLNNFDFDPKTIPSIDGDFSIPATIPSMPLPDQRYVSLPSQPQTLPPSVSRPLEQPAQQHFQYPDPILLHHGPRPYYTPQPVPSTKAMMQHQHRAITPPGQQVSSLDHSLFLHGNVTIPRPTAAASYPYAPVPTYQDDSAFNPEDLALSDISDDLLATWASLPDLSTYHTSTSSSYNNNDLPDSDDSYHPPSSPAKKAHRTRRRSSRPPRILPNGQVKKGRPCAKPQTEERLRVNQRRMEGYYRRKYEQGNLERTRQQSKESYWKRKQRRIDAGEKVRSYHTVNKK